MEENENILIPSVANEAEETMENSLRPKNLSEYIGQTKVKENIEIYIK